MNNPMKAAAFQILLQVVCNGCLAAAKKKMCSTSINLLNLVIFKAGIESCLHQP